MKKVVNHRVPVLVAWTALIVLAGACANQAVSASEPMPTQPPPATTAAATPPQASQEPTEVLDSGESATSWHQQGSGQLLEIPSCFDLDQGVVSGAPDPACDINFLAVSQPGSVDIYPTNGAQIDQTAADLQTAQSQCADRLATGDNPLTVDPASNPGLICIHTKQGGQALLGIVGADFKAAYTVTFDWWTLDSSVAAGAPPQDSMPLAYANATYGFQLTFPESWDGYHVKELAGSGVGSVCFSFAGDMPICVLQVDVFTHAQWSQLEKLNEGYYLGENDDYVFGAGPFTEACVQMDEFQCDRYHELPVILETFKAG